MKADTTCPRRGERVGGGVKARDVHRAAGGSRRGGVAAWRRGGLAAAGAHLVVRAERRVHALVEEPLDVLLGDGGAGTAPLFVVELSVLAAPSHHEDRKGRPRREPSVGGWPHVACVHGHDHVALVGDVQQLAGRVDPERVRVAHLDGTGRTEVAHLCCLTERPVLREHCTHPAVRSSVSRAQGARRSIGHREVVPRVLRYAVKDVDQISLSEARGHAGRDHGRDATARRSLVGRRRASGRESADRAANHNLALK